MKRVTSLFVALALGCCTALPAFALEQVTTNAVDQYSPVFLHKASIPAQSPADREAWAASTPLATSHRHFDLRRQMSYGMQAGDGSPDAGASSVADQMNGAEKKNPGRALLLSAIMPGAGELYAGASIRSAAFFALELGCWYGAVSYAQRGNNKTKDFERYVDHHWNEQIYRNQEYQFAIEERGDAGDVDLVVVEGYDG